MKKEEIIKGNIKNKVDLLSINHLNKNSKIDNSISNLKQMILNNTLVVLYTNNERQISIVDMLLEKLRLTLKDLKAQKNLLLKDT